MKCVQDNIVKIELQDSIHPNASCVTEEDNFIFQVWLHSQGRQQAQGEGSGMSKLQVEEHMWLPELLVTALGTCIFQVN